MNISDIFKKVGIKVFDDLNPAEQEAFRKWEAILTKPEPTIEDLKKILPSDLQRANEELRKYENSKEKDSYYKAYATLCEFILNVVATPTKEREQLKAMLKQKYGLD